MPERRGEKKGTFVVEVEYCRNATWQGTIRWINGEKTQHFRSELELITLMADVLRHSGEDSPIVPMAKIQQVEETNEADKTGM